MDDAHSTPSPQTQTARRLTAILLKLIELLQTPLDKSCIFGHFQQKTGGIHAGFR
jgi:hypothetical protein